MTLSVYLSEVTWHGRRRDVLVTETGTGALIGISLLIGSRVEMDVVDGGVVTIEELPQSP